MHYLAFQLQILNFCLTKHLFTKNTDENGQNKAI